MEIIKIGKKQNKIKTTEGTFKTHSLYGSGLTTIQGCRACAFIGDDACSKAPCTPWMRHDGKHVYFFKVTE